MFHLTPVDNLTSILKHGIVPTNIYLSHMREYFRETWDIEKASFYTPEQSGYSLDKLFKDFVYWQILKKPISVELGKDKYNKINWDIPLNVNTKREERFIILKVKDLDLDFSFHHAQCTGQSKCYLDCMEEYGHDNKLVYITPKIVNNFKVVGDVNFRMERYNKPNIKVKWRRRLI